MGWFNKKSESTPIDELSEKEIMAVLKKGKIPIRSAKDLKKMKQDDLRRTVGEKGLGALKAAAKESSDRRFQQLERSMRSGKDPHAVTRMKTEDPKRYQQLLEQEARKQGLL